ncbi:MAG: M17 family peptidase N-terminal domain-containing protein [Myxococcota bacterium]
MSSRPRASARAGVRLEAISRDVLDGVLQADADAPQREHVDLCVLPWFSDERPLQGVLGLLDWRGDGCLSDLARGGYASGAWDEAVLLPARRGMPAARLLLLGCGPRADFGEDLAEQVGARVARAALGLRPASVLLAMPSVAGERDVLESLFSGMLRGLEDESRSAPASFMTTPPHRWWVVVEERHLARLRRLLDGPLRAALETSSSS